MCHKNLVSEWDAIANKLRGDRNLNRYYIALSMVIDELIKSDCIMDVGCGQGLFLSCLQTLNCDRLIGLDISPVMVKKMCSHVQKANGIVADAHHLPFKEECFDIIFATDAIEHWEHPFLGMIDISRVTKKWGKIVITTSTFVTRLDFGRRSKQPIDAPVHPLIFKKLLNKHLTQLAYYSKGLPGPFYLFIFLFNFHPFISIMRANKIFSIIIKRIFGVHGIDVHKRINKIEILKKVLFYKTRIKKTKNFPLIKYLFLSSDITILLTPKKG